MQIKIELLIGTEVCDVDGNSVGRIEEFRVEREEKSCLVESYLVGTSALIERLSAWTLVRPIGHLLRTRKFLTVYEIPWQDMDLSDPHHPRLRIGKRDLRHAK
jgi:sporulation protein YlmC with PRC-barrel domain